MSSGAPKPSEPATALVSATGGVTTAAAAAVEASVTVVAALAAEAAAAAFAAGAPLHDIRHVGEPEIDSLTLNPGDWVLVTRADGTPYAWIDAEGVKLHREGRSLYDSTIAGGSLFRPDGTLRLALDAALSSPAGLGVAVEPQAGNDLVGHVASPSASAAS